MREENQENDRQYKTEIKRPDPGTTAQQKSAQLDLPGRFEFAPKLRADQQAAEDEEKVNAAPAIDDEGKSLDFRRSGECRTEVAPVDQNDGHAAQDVQKGDIAGWPGKQVVPPALKQARDGGRTRGVGIVRNGQNSLPWSRSERSCTVKCRYLT